MRRAAKFAVFFAMALIAVLAAFLFIPQISELGIVLTCSRTAPSASCVTRMRAMGHVWSRRDNLDRAAGWYERAARDGQDEASMFHLAWTYEQSGIRNIVPTMLAAEKAAEQAAANNAPIPDRPNGLEPFARAEEWYRKSAEKGFAPAKNNLGQLYLTGMLHSASREEGFRLCMEAARTGNPVAAMNVALAYSDGMGVTRDLAEATRWGTWSAKDYDPRDLQEPTLSRTHLFGTELPPEIRASIRASVESGRPLTSTFRPLPPDPSLPTFSSVRNKLNKN